jgi:hypothetical protein
VKDFSGSATFFNHKHRHDRPILITNTDTTGRARQRSPSSSPKEAQTQMEILTHAMSPLKRTRQSLTCVILLRRSFGRCSKCRTWTDGLHVPCNDPFRLVCPGGCGCGKRLLRRSLGIAPRQSNAFPPARFGWNSRFGLPGSDWRPEGGRP